MEQLLSMGFSDKLAEQALSATGGDSPTKAIEWILNQPQLNDTKINVVSTLASASSSAVAAAAPKQSPHSSQANLHRFFNFPSKCPQNDDVPTPSPDSSAPSPTPTPPQNDMLATHSKKRLRLSPPPPPLSERMRPRTLDDVVGQGHLLSSKSSLLRSAVDRGRLPSLVLWGPPGSGKTSIARAILGSLSVSSFRFVSFSAVTSGVKDVRDAVDEARRVKAKSNTTTLLFVDEVHRFNKSQQDSFLPIIEDGSVVFVGATTENPSFHLTTPLLSRCRLLLLQPLQPHHLSSLLHRAVDDPCNGIRASVGAVPIRVDDDAIHFISNNCDGDARAALNALEIATVAAAASSAQDAAVVIVSLEDAKEALQCKHLAYDKGGEEHYNCISALHKSMRGNDANAGIYWLARMLEGGEQPLYIARRLIRFASEDVGLADPLALNQAVACYQACHFLGMPECNVILAQCVAYLALAPKSVAIYRAIGAAQKAVKESDGQNEGVPLHLRNAPTKLMKEIGYGKDYIYTPDNPSAFQSYLPPSLEGRKFLDWPTSDETPLHRC